MNDRDSNEALSWFLSEEEFNNKNNTNMKNTAFIKIPAIPDGADVDISDASQVFKFFQTRPCSWFIFLYKNEIYKMSEQYHPDSESTYFVEKEMMYFDKKDKYVVDQFEINKEILQKCDDDLTRIKEQYEKRVSELLLDHSGELERMRENFDHRIEVVRRDHRNNSVDRKLLLESIAASNGKTLNFN